MASPNIPKNEEKREVQPKRSHQMIHTQNSITQERQTKTITDMVQTDSIDNPLHTIAKNG
jgi:hypothetical protein